MLLHIFVKIMSHKGYLPINKSNKETYFNYIFFVIIKPFLLPLSFQMETIWVVLVKRALSRTYSSCITYIMAAMTATPKTTAPETAQNLDFRMQALPMAHNACVLVTGHVMMELLANLHVAFLVLGLVCRIFVGDISRYQLTEVWSYFPRQYVSKIRCGGWGWLLIGILPCLHIVIFY